MTNRYPPSLDRAATRRHGFALVEFALICPLLLLLLAGVLDYALALRTATIVANAARVGAQFGSSSVANVTNTAGIQAAAVNSAPSLTGLTVTSTSSCQCPNGSVVGCGGSCTGNMLMYSQVTVQEPTTEFFNYSGLPFTNNISAQSTMRAQ